jgi:hypothetical protein
MTTTNKFLTPSNINKVKTLIEKSHSTHTNTITWTKIQNDLENLLWNLYCQAPVKNLRLKYYESGLFELLIPVIKDTNKKFSIFVVEACWGILSSGMAVVEVNERDNIETLAKGVELGFVELAVFEIKKKPLRYNGRLMDRSCVVLTNTSSYAEFVNRTIASGSAEACLDFIRQGGDVQSDTFMSNLDKTLTILNSIGRYHIECIKSLPGLVEAVSPYLPLLAHHHNEHDIMIGFDSARLLIRVTSKEDCAKVIHENPILLEFYPKLISQLMKVGPNRNYFLYDAFWVMVGLVLDVSIMAKTLDGEEKELLIPFIPLVLNMIIDHNNKDPDTFRYGMIFLCEIVQNEKCLTIIGQQYMAQLEMICKMIFADMEQFKETLCLLDEVMGKVASG